MNKFKGKDLFDSPYKHCLSEIKCVETNNEDDNFTTPKVTKRIPKPIKKQVKKKPKCKSHRIDTLFRKAKNNDYELDINPDHLQMAIALSKSTLDQENPEESKHVNVEDSQLLFGKNCDQKLGNMLEKYGFRSNKSSCNLGAAVLNQAEAYQRRQYSRFRYILLSSTKEDRDALIEKKISAILSQFDTNFENETTGCSIFSDMLKNYHVKQNKLLKVNSLDSNEDVTNYYTKKLDLPITQSSCGSLLKDWKDIPGREISPSCEEQIQEDPLSESFCSSNSKFGLENTYSSKSLRGRSTYTIRKNNNFESKQTSSYDSHNENDYLASTSNSFVANKAHDQNKVKGNDCQADIKKKNIEMDLVGSTKSNQVETVCNDSPRNFDLNRSNTFDSVTGTKHFKFSFDQQSDISIEDLESISESKKCDQSFSNKPKLSESISKEDAKSSAPHTYCSSPDLFSSDDDNIVETSKNYSKFQDSPHTSCDQKGIEYFESFSADSCALTQEMYKSSNPEAYNSIPHKTVTDQIKDDQDESDQVIIVLDSDEDSNMIVGNKENKESGISKNGHIGIKCSPHTSDTLSCLMQMNADNISELDDSELSLSKINNKDNIRSKLQKNLSTKNILKHSCNRNSLYTDDTGSYVELKVIPPGLDSESNEIKNIKDNEKVENPPIISDQKMDIKDHYYERKIQANRSPLNCISNNLIADMEFDSPRCSSTSKLYSPSFNSNSKLNITEYIENMLGEDCITGNDVDDKQNDKELSLSQSSSESIIISDEELNCTKIQYRATDACCDYDELGDENASSGEETEEAKGIITENDHKLISEPQKRSVNFNDSFNRLLQNSEILDGLDNLACESETNLTSYSKCKAIENKSRTNQDPVPVTPKSNLIIKTRDVTPMPDYDKMSSDEIVEELKKFRVKPLKRQRGITMLKYIYECTHPMIPTNEEYRDEEEENRIFKKRRKDKSSDHSCNEDNVTKIKCKDVVCKSEIIECENPEDLIFERKFRAKLAYCRIPLQIVWYNFVQSNPELKKKILLYEPLHLNSVYAMLKEQSNCKFHIEDFITFLDKKSITFRTS